MNTDFPGMASGSRPEVWNKLRASHLELMTATVLPRPTTKTWQNLVGTDEGITLINGSFSGPLLQGVDIKTVVTGNYDRQTDRIKILAKVDMRLDDGALLRKVDEGYWCGINKALERLLQGDSVADSEYYFIGVPRYFTSEPRYSWLEHGSYLTRGYVEGDQLNIAQFRVVEPANGAPAYGRARFR